MDRCVSEIGDQPPTVKVSRANLLISPNQRNPTLGISTRKKKK